MDRTAPWRRRLDELTAAGLRRQLRALHMTGPVTAELDGHEVIVACSNDYLGLAHDPEVRAAAAGGGSGASRLISGTRPVHLALEAELEALLGRPALLFATGFQANLAACATALEPGDVVASDALNHASLIDGLRLSRAERRIVPHADPTAVPADARMVVVEGLYSMDGDVPDLAAYPTGPWLYVDEAHAFGVLGPQGRGAAAAAGVTPDVLVGTFGKACGAAGAFVAGPPELKELLVSRGRAFIFSTAPPEPVAAMALAGLRRAVAADDLRERLAARVARFRTGLAQLGWTALGDAHIVPVVVGDRAMELADRLLQHGVFAPGIRPPTVPVGTERIRFTLSAAHTPAQVDRILDALGPAA